MTTRMKKSEPSAIRLQQGGEQGHWAYHFRGYRKQPPGVWRIKRVKPKCFHVVSPIDFKLKICFSLTEVREHIASHYEYV